MSYIQRNNKNSQKFCNVCHKAGKSEKEYTSHYIKSVPGPNGIVVCPTILSSECTFCFKLGHWANEEHCPALREKKRAEKKAECQQRREQFRGQPVTHTNQPMKPLQKLSSYDVLRDDDDHTVIANNPVNKPTEDWPQLTTTLKSVEKTNVPGPMSYASMAKKEYVPEKTVEFSELAFDTLTPRKNAHINLEPKTRLFTNAITSGRVGNIDMLKTRYMDCEEDEDDWEHEEIPLYEEEQDDMSNWPSAWD